MDEEVKTNETVEEASTEDPIIEAAKTQMKKVQMAALLNGSQAICHVILGYIAEFTMAPGKKSFRQQEKLIKRIREFCETGISRTIDENGEIVPIKKTEAEHNHEIQNNS